jgi:dipeptidyl aminopeptidase/acylaminoacyl peptidase
MKLFFYAAITALLALAIACGGADKKEDQQTISTKDTNVKSNVKSDVKSNVKHYTMEQFMNTVSISGGSFSHDDSSVFFTSNKTGIYNVYELALADEKAEPRQVTKSTKESTYLRTTFPKDNRLVVSADSGGNEIYHLFLRNTDGTLKELTAGKKERATFSGWSRDSKSFFYLSSKRDPRFMDVYRMNISDFSEELFYKNENGYDSNIEISDDERYIALLKTRTSYDSTIFLFDRKTNQNKNITPHEGNVSNTPLCFDRNSKVLYFMTDENSEFNYVKSYNLENGTYETVIQKNWPISSFYFSWNGTYRVTTINEDGRTVVEIFDTKKMKPVELPQFPGANVSSINFSRSEKWMSFYVSGSTSPRNLYVYNFETGAVRKLTDSMNPEIDQNDLSEAAVIRYKSFDGLEIPAIFYKPKYIPEGQKIPALVWVHGGPGGQSRVGYRDLLQYLANHGYAVLAVNNRGSSGYGKTFFKLDDLKHGEDDLMDCVEAKKFLKSTGFVDENKIGIIGGSYGGYMVLAALAYQPDAFTVGVDIFGVANWVRTLKSIPAWWESYREALYKEMGNPQTDLDYLKRISPLFHADKITKPLIVLQGANDPRVLKVESDEIVEAVKKKGVPVEYIVFEDEGHGFRKKVNSIRANKAILKFLDKYLKQKEETYIY